METCLKKIAILARLSPGVMGGALLAILVIVSSVHAGWLLEDQKLTASDAVEGDEFGVRVAISGEIAVISAPADGENGYRYGSVYVFIHQCPPIEQLLGTNRAIRVLRKLARDFPVMMAF